MKIVIGYIHGFGSVADINNIKVQTLMSMEIDGVELVIFPLHYDSLAGPLYTKKILQRQIKNLEIDVLVGTSLGGFWARQFTLPYIALNPVVSPYRELHKYLNIVAGYTDHGSHSKQAPVPRYLTKDVLNSYLACGIGFAPNGLVLLNKDDPVLNSLNTKAHLKSLLVGPEYKMIDDDSHQFDNIDDDEVLSYIENFIKELANENIQSI